MNIGCVRMTERHLHGDPPTARGGRGRHRGHRRALALVAVSVPVGQARTLVGLAGSVTTVGAIALGLDQYDSDRIHHSRVPAARVHEIAG